MLVPLFDRRRYPSARAAMLLWTAAATVAFAQPLVWLVIHTLDDQLSSYIPLIPFVTIYLLYEGGCTLPSGIRAWMPGAMLFSIVGLSALAARAYAGDRLSINDGLVLTTTAYIAAVYVGACLCLGAAWLRKATLPMAFLAFTIPLPDAVVGWLEDALVLASADASAFLFRLFDTPLVRDGTTLQLPGIVLGVAQECSGIRSTWILFITSVLASSLFLTSPWRRLVLIAFVIPLGIIRNAVRILVIGLLCVHIGPHMIDSVIHRRGGPLFFALSLAPLFGLLLWLRRREQ